MLSLLLPCAFSCCSLEMEVSSKVPSDVLLPPLLDPALEQVQLLSKKWCWRWWKPCHFLYLSPHSSSAVSPCLKSHINIGFKGGMMCFVNSGTLSDCPPLMIPSNPCSRWLSGTCTAAPLLFIGIPSCGFLPFYFSVCKFTFLTSVNLQFVPQSPDPFTSCRESSNAWFSNLCHPQT